VKYAAMSYTSMDQQTYYLPNNNQQLPSQYVDNFENMVYYC